MNLDDAMMAKLLATYGAPATANNIQAARTFFASNPEIAEKRAMGMRGSGIDDNSDVFGAQLDKFIAASDPGVTVNAMGADKGQLPAAPSPQPEAGPARRSSPSRQGGYGPGKEGITKQDKDYGPGTPSADGGSGLEWLLALLGARARGGTTRVERPPNAGGTPEATFVGPMRNVDPNTDPRLQGYPRSGQGALPAPQQRLTGPQAGGAAPNATEARPQGVLEDNISDLSRVKTNEPPPTRVDGDPELTRIARENQLKAEIDAENAAQAAKDAEQKRLMDQIAERNKRQQETSKLLKEGTRVRTGRPR